MPWQRLVADVAGEEIAPGVPAYREVIVTVPRQSGKTTEILIWEIDRAILWERQPQTIAYTAQTGQDARKKLVEDQVPLIESSAINASIKKVLRGIADTAVYFSNGSRINVLASTEDSGHGKTLDLGVIDEAMADDDDRREQALLPTMATRADAQMLIFSTAGTERSTLFRRKVDAGRQAVAEGRTSGIAYFEWSAPDDADPDDHDVWRACMPALGHTITEGVVEHARQTMSDGEFRRAYLNQWTVSDERVIPIEAWDAAQDGAASPHPKVFSVDATPDRSMSAIAVADDVSGEVVDHRAGVGWLLDRCDELAKKWDAPFAIDAYSPVGHLIEPLRGRGVRVREYGARTYGYACGSFFDRVMDGNFRIRPHPGLEDAAAGARKRSLGDAWAWARKDAGIDISPLVALTIAADAAGAHDEPDPGLVVAFLD